jgi:hypothetical protein
MLKATALEYFDGKRAELARALQPTWSPQAIYLWDEIVPLAAARKLAELSGGRLEVIEDFYNAKGNITAEARKKHKPRRRA